MPEWSARGWPIRGAEIKVCVEIEYLHRPDRFISAAVRGERCFVSTAKYHRHACVALRANQLAYVVRELALGDFEVILLSSDGADVDELALLVDGERSECASKGRGAFGCALTAPISLNALIGGEPDEVHGASRRLCRGLNDAMPSCVLWAWAIVASGPCGGGGEKGCVYGVHASQA